MEEKSKHGGYGGTRRREERGNPLARATEEMCYRPQTAGANNLFWQQQPRTWGAYGGERDDIQGDEWNIIKGKRGRGERLNRIFQGTAEADGNSLQMRYFHD